MKEKRMKFIKPEDWLSNSPDAAPCDYFLWGYLRSRLARHRTNSIKGLKVLIRKKLAQIPIEMVQNALSAWPRRVYETSGT